MAFLNFHGKNVSRPLHVSICIGLIAYLIKLFNQELYFSADF